MRHPRHTASRPARRRCGSRLHGQLVLLFSVVAVTPTIIVAIFSLLFFNLGVDAWFSEDTQGALRALMAKLGK